VRIQTVGPSPVPIVASNPTGTSMRAVGTRSAAAGGVRAAAPTRAVRPRRARRQCTYALFGWCVGWSGGVGWAACMRPRVLAPAWLCVRTCVRACEQDSPDEIWGSNSLCPSEGFTGSMGAWHGCTEGGVHICANSASSSGHISGQDWRTALPACALHTQGAKGERREEVEGGGEGGDDAGAAGAPPQAAERGRREHGQDEGGGQAARGAWVAWWAVGAVGVVPGGAWWPGHRCRQLGPAAQLLHRWWARRHALHLTVGIKFQYDRAQWCTALQAVSRTLASKKAERQAERDSLAKGIMPEVRPTAAHANSASPCLRRGACRTCPFPLILMRGGCLTPYAMPCPSRASRTGSPTRASATRRRMTEWSSPCYPLGIREWPHVAGSCMHS